MSDHIRLRLTLHASHYVCIVCLVTPLTYTYLTAIRLSKHSPSLAIEIADIPRCTYVHSTITAVIGHVLCGKVKLCPFLRSNAILLIEKEELANCKGMHTPQTVLEC